MPVGAQSLLESEQHRAFTAECSEEEAINSRFQVSEGLLGGGPRRAFAAECSGGRTVDSGCRVSEHLGVARAPCVAALLGLHGWDRGGSSLGPGWFLGFRWRSGDASG